VSTAGIPRAATRYHPWRHLPCVRTLLPPFTTTRRCDTPFWRALRARLRALVACCAYTRTRGLLVWFAHRFGSVRAARKKEGEEGGERKSLKAARGFSRQRLAALTTSRFLLCHCFRLSPFRCATLPLPLHYRTAYTLYHPTAYLRRCARCTLAHLYLFPASAGSARSSRTAPLLYALTSGRAGA